MGQEAGASTLTRPGVPPNPALARLATVGCWVVELPGVGTRACVRLLFLSSFTW